MRNLHGAAHWLTAALGACLSTACDSGVITDSVGSATQPGDGDDASEGEPAMLALTFAGSDAELVNPERGLYRMLDLVAANGGAGQRAAGGTLAIALVRLDAYRDAPLDAGFLAQLGAGFADVRTAGIKVILRFMYNSGVAPDASKARILEHLEQLRPVLAANADVIAVMQAGMIGAWGEWHSSTSGLDNDADRAEITHKLLDVLPASRSLQLRTPMYKAAIFPGGPLPLEEAWSGSARSRVGHHNDCFLASPTDSGTFAQPVEQWLSYVAEEGRFTPIGGETCAVNAPRTDCAQATAALEDGRWSYLNAQYKREVLDGWAAQGCAGEVQRRLGYRIALTRATVSEVVAPGGELAIALELANTGYAAPFNPRPLRLVLRRGDQRWVARLDRDARTLLPGTSIVSVRLRVPAAATAGDHELGLWLPDDADSLRDDPRYAIQLANEGIWDPASGLNLVTRALRIDPAAPGPVDQGATDFVQLP